MPRALRFSFAVLLASLAAPAAASATPPGVPVAVGAGGERAGSCATAPVPGAPGVAITHYAAPAAGALTVRSAGAGDWDLALFDAASGRPLAASATFGAREMATAYLARGGRVTIQACRRPGAGERLELGLDFFAPPAAAVEAEPARLVSVSLGSPGDVRRLEALGLDVTHEGTGRVVDVVLYSAAEAAALRRDGFSFVTRIADLGAADRAARAAERAESGRAAQALPSGRTAYRTYADYGEELKALVRAHPGLVRPVRIGDSLEGRPIEGVEIAVDVERPAGRPVFLLGGLTHAREWPGGEAAMEFALDMARSAAADARVRRMLERTRVVVLPLLNPDGYVVSREAGTAMGQDAGDDSPQEATLGFAATDAMAYKRKNCRADVPENQDEPCAMRTRFGVDLNRAYGAFWGGDGSSSDNTTQQYRGPQPFSEPEAIAVRAFGAATPVQTFITNHTFTDVGRWLRQPGFKVENDPVPDVTPDEAPMKKLGDAMAAATGYTSELGYETLGNITGPSDDFLYYSQGTLGYTPELRGDNFHTNYADAVIGEYEGEGDQKGKGLREAYLLAAEQAANPADHAVMRGRAPAGRVLRLRKTTQLTTSDDENGDGTKDKPAVVFDETLDWTTVVPASGAYAWHVNPSTRPLAPAREAFVLTCETPQGAVLERSSVTVDRGEVAVRDLACGAGDPDPAPRAGRVTLRRPTVSARAVARRRGLTAYVGLRGLKLRRVRIRLLDRRGRIVAGRRVARLSSSTRIRLARRRTPRAGRHRLVLTARDASGRRVRVTLRVRLRR